jgi:dTDP-glucose 4,6-dehydratase
MTIIVTGGAGFIGANFILEWLACIDEKVINLDKLTYAGNLASLTRVAQHKNYHFIQGDIVDSNLLTELFAEFKPRAIINFAAESHVDRSIHDPSIFIQTNIMGTFKLLEASCQYWQNLTAKLKNSFRFLHVSTDEVYGSLEPSAPAFTEHNRYEPNSPYSASKAASDHLVRAYHHTYGLPVLTTNCSNNYGPFQFPEKLIPILIHNALTGKKLPIYGDGSNHCSAIRKVLSAGRLGETYNIGGLNEKTNLEVVNCVCEILDRLQPRTDKISYQTQIHFIKDRAGHDKRYAIDASKIQQELAWQPAVTFDQGLEQTVEWYLQNTSWVNNIIDGSYQNWLETQYAN